MRYYKNTSTALALYRAGSWHFELRKINIISNLYIIGKRWNIRAFEWWQSKWIIKWQRCIYIRNTAFVRHGYIYKIIWPCDSAPVERCCTAVISARHNCSAIHRQSALDIYIKGGVKCPEGHRDISLLHMDTLATYCFPNRSFSRQFHVIFSLLYFGGIRSVICPRLILKQKALLVRYRYIIALEEDFLIFWFTTLRREQRWIEKEKRSNKERHSWKMEQKSEWHNVKKGDVRQRDEEWQREPSEMKKKFVPLPLACTSSGVVFQTQSK